MTSEAWFMRHRTDTSPSCHKSFILGDKNEEKPLKNQGKVEGCFAAPMSVCICAVCCRKAVSPQPDLAKAPFPNRGSAGSQKGAAWRGQQTCCAEAQAGRGWLGIVLLPPWVIPAQRGDRYGRHRPGSAAEDSPLLGTPSAVSFLALLEDT